MAKKCKVIIPWGGAFFKNQRWAKLATWKIPWGLMAPLAEPLDVGTDGKLYRIRIKKEWCCGGYPVGLRDYLDREIRSRDAFNSYLHRYFKGLEGDYQLDFLEFRERQGWYEIEEPVEATEQRGGN